MNIDLRTDPRAADLWRRLSPSVDAMAELLGDDVPALGDTRYATLLRHFEPACPDYLIELAVIGKLRLTQSIKQDGFSPKTPLVVAADPNTGQLSFIDGTHRACCLLVLGEPVQAVLQDPLPSFDPLARYPESHEQ